MSSLATNFNKLSLNDINSVDESKFPELTNEGKALSSQFLTLSGRFDDSANLTTLNDSLRNTTFVTGNTPSKTDLVVFEKVLPLAKQWKSTDDIAKYRHILRWGDLMQNKFIDVSDSDKITIDYNIEIPREVKEKKKKESKDKQEQPQPAAKSSEKQESKDSKAPLSEEEKKERAEAAKAKKAAKAKANAEKEAQKQAATAAPSPSMVDFKVGFIQKAIKHPNADSLYVSTIDCGEEEPRTICSGLVKYIPLEQMQERYVVIVANLKPVAMRGIKSNGMVLCASTADKVEFVNPPSDSKPGDKLFFQDFNGTPEKQLNPKKKIFETVQPLLSTTDAFEVTYTEEGKEPKKLVNEKGESCKNSTLVKAEVK